MCGLFAGNDEVRTLNTMVTYDAEWDSFQFQLSFDELGMVYGDWYCTCTSAELLRGATTMTSKRYSDIGAEMDDTFTMTWNGNGYDYVWIDKTDSIIVNNGTKSKV